MDFKAAVMVVTLATHPAAVPATGAPESWPSWPSGQSLPLIGPVAYPSHNDPTPYRSLSAQEAAQFDLGHAVFNTQWLPDGTPGGGRRVGLGPRFNAASCDACHNEGDRARGPVGSGELPLGLVIQLARRGADGREDDIGDPVYGTTFNTQAVAPALVPGEIRVNYAERPGAYADGRAWSLRVPDYQVLAAKFGPLAPDTIIRPRIAPALYGVGLLDAAVLASPSPDGVHGRFGWLASAVSVRDQTARAFASEMGLTTRDRPLESCPPGRLPCATPDHAPPQEVADELMSALLVFLGRLGVPRSPDAGSETGRGEALAAASGCLACHQRELAVVPDRKTQRETRGRIHAFTDLRVHDLGPDLADRTVAGRPVPTSWRTAPLWGIGYASRAGREARFLHDGRARTLEEAILWHGGEAREARERFVHLASDERQAIVQWLLAQ